MVNRKFVTLALFIFAGGAGFIPSVLAYNDDTTHRAITQEAIRLFEFYNPNQNFLDWEKELIIQGSEDEDEAPRWLSHFYDPVHNRGFKGGRSSKDWAQNPSAQAFRLANGVINDYFSDSDDFSWQRAIYEYTWRDKDRALLSLGHVLHLVQDVTVPDHTRDDAHILKKTYEKYAERFTTSNFRLADELRARGQKPIRLNSLNKYFDALASFSNGNFFSDDTILDDYFSEPLIKKESTIKLKDGILYRFGFGKLGQNLTRIDSKRNLFSGKIEKAYQLDDIDNLVASDYWQHLSEKAVLGSAGVIELFFKEVAAEKESRRLFDLNESYLKRFLKHLSLAVKNTLKALSSWWTDSGNLEPESTGNNSGDEKKLKADNSPNSSQPSTKDEFQIVKEDEIEIEQEEIDRLMVIVLDLQKQLMDYLARLDEADDSEGKILNGREVEEIIKESRQVYESVAGFSGGGSGNGLADNNLINDENKVVVVSPKILSPSDFSTSFSSTTITFLGTSTPGMTVFCDFGHNNAVVSDSETGEWALEIVDLPQGFSVLNFYARDSENHVSDPETIEVLIDSLPAIISFEIEECKNSFLDDYCVISPVEKLNISWQINKGEYVSYELQKTWEFWRLAGEEVNEKLAETTETELELDCDCLPNHPVGWLLVLTAKNHEGEEIRSEPFEIWFDPWPVIINEIGWAGTAASPADEWLELYNPLPFEISLENFQLIGLDNKPLIQLSGVIGGQSFYLIERNDDQVVSNLPANLIAGFVENPEEEGLPDEGLQLKLIKKMGEIEIIFDQTPLFVPSLYYSEGSIERNWLKEGVLFSSWGGVNVYWSQNGLDRNNELIRGTPLIENSILRVMPM